MGLFDIFKKGSTPKVHKGFYELKIAEIVALSKDAVKIVFDIPFELKKEFEFVPGQYVNLNLTINKTEIRRSYSVCSGTNEALAIGVKAINKGQASSYLVHSLKVGDYIQLSKPEGSFGIKNSDSTIVAFAAGSGITPILSIAKSIEGTNKNLTLFYGSKSFSEILFHEELSKLSNTKTIHFLSQESHDGCLTGRIDEKNLRQEIKSNLDLLKADSFLICGPEAMIQTVEDNLKFFGVSSDKIRYELFTTPVLLASQQTEATHSDFSGESSVKVILEGETTEFNLNTTGDTILQASENEGLDVPFSCRGGVCCSCKAKVLEGSASMKLNYSLTDEEVKKGYILTCQAHPTSKNVTITFNV
jgi:ring-1,2-phenylacetyl-CoA epoxidase subunit PaaE